MSEQQIGRLALRREGKWWAAYYAMPDTMNGALPLGRIRMGILYLTFPNPTPCWGDATRLLLRLFRADHLRQRAIQRLGRLVGFGFLRGLDDAASPLGIRELGFLRWHDGEHITTRGVS